MYIQMKRMLVGILCAFSFLQSSAQLRQQYILKDNWEFRSDKSGADAIWEKVTVPHCWNAEGWYNCRLLSWNNSISLSLKHITGNVEETCFFAFRGS